MRRPTPRRVRSPRLIRSLAFRIGGVGVFPRRWLGICCALCRSSAPWFPLELGGACSAVFSSVAMDALDIFPPLIGLQKRGHTQISRLDTHILWAYG
jgi:hypothetical protein